MSDARAGHSYSVSAWLRTSNVAETSALVINFWNADGVHLGTYSSPTLTGSNDWTKLVATAVAPPGSASLRFECRLTGPGTLWADDVMLTAD